MGLSWQLSGKDPAYNAGDCGSIPGSGRSPGGGHGNPLEYSYLENPWTEEPGRLYFIGSYTDMTEATKQQLHVGRHGGSKGSKQAFTGGLLSHIQHLP